MRTLNLAYFLSVLVYSCSRLIEVLFTNRFKNGKALLLCAIMYELCMYVYVLEVQLSVAIKLGKEEKFCENAEGPNPAGNPASSWPDCWPDCGAVLNKNVIGLCLIFGRESGRIVTGQLV